MAQHRASPVTVQKSLRVLTDEGLVESRVGVGTFVRDARTVRPTDHGWQTAALRSPAVRAPSVATALRSATNDVVALHSGFPDRTLLPERLVRAALARAARGESAVARPPVAGLPALQSWFAAEIGASPGDVVVLAGSQSGLGSIFRSVVLPGEPVILESPTYWGAIRAAAQAGVRVVPVPSGPDGPNPADLDRAFRESGARLFYAQPTYANPTGAQWSPDRAEQVLQVVGRHGAFLVEDDWAHEFGITSRPRPLAAQDGDGRVIYLRSLTKSVSPSLRVAAVVARGPVRARILADQSAEALYVSALLQTAALDVVTQPAWHTHLVGVRRQLRDRRDLLVSSLRTHAPTTHLASVPAGGVNLWLQLPHGVDEQAVARDCEAHGVLVAPGAEWFPAEPTGAFLRLSFAGPDPSGFPRGAQVIGEVLADVCR